MAVANEDCIIKFGSGVVYEVRIETQEDFSIDDSGKRTINVERSLITTQTAEKQDITATDAYAQIIAPFQLDDYPFYAVNVSLRRVNHVYGRRTSREAGGTGMVAVARWVCSVTYETASRVSQERREDLQKKTDEYPVITWTSNRFDMATTADVFGNPYRNTAGDFYSGISRPAEERIYSVSLNVPVQDPANPGVDLVNVMTAGPDGPVPKTPREIGTEIQAIEAAGTRYEPYYTNLYNYTNNAPVRVRGQYWDVNTLRVGSMQVGEILIDKSEIYYRVEFSLIGRPWGWHREVANRGMNELEYVIPAGVFGEKEYHPDPNTFTLGRIAGAYNMTDAEIAQRLNEVYLTTFAATDVQEMTDFILFNVTSARKVAIKDSKGRLIAQPVFLDGWGQAQKATGIVPGRVGDITVASGGNIATTSFNVLEYLGAKMLVEGFDKPMFVPHTRQGFVRILKLAGMAAASADAYADPDVTVANVLPLTFSLGEAKLNDQGGYDYTGLTFFTAPASVQLGVSIAPGITSDYQDYYGADLTALPGVYSA